MESLLFRLAFAAYTVAMVFYLLFAVSRKDALPRIGQWSLSTAVGLHLISLVLRTHAGWSHPENSWYVPWSNWFESISFFAWVMSIEFLVLLLARPLPILGAFVTPIVWICLLFAVHSPAGGPARTMHPSPWMAAHIPLMFMAYAAFALAFGIGLAFLLEEYQLKTKRVSNFVFRLPSLDELDGMVSRVIRFGFPVLTAGLMIGMVWANKAWGQIWSWTPKETWSFVTWLIYAAYLLTRRFGGWRGRKSAYLSIAGFVMVLVTYIGVNFVSGGHGVGSMDRVQMTNDE